MPRDPQTLVYVGIKNVVVALDAATGAEVWRTQIRGSGYINVLWDGNALLVSSSGEVWRLDPATGTGLWHNELKGLGRGLVSLATSRHPTSTQGHGLLAKAQMDAQAAAAAGAV